jgi:dihydroorotase
MSRYIGSPIALEGAHGTQKSALLIKNGRVIDPASGRDELADVLIAKGVVVEIGAHGSAVLTRAIAQVSEDLQEIDATGCWVSPGLVDLAARLREPGYEYKATLESEMQAALAGGVTSLCCPPDTDPPLDEPGLVEMLKHRARTLDQARLYPLGALTSGLKGEVITEMAELAEAGCVGFSHALFPLSDSQVLVRAMQYAKTFDFTLWLHPQDAALAKGGVVHGGPIAGRLGLPGIPVMAETVALFTIFEAVRVTGCRVHLCRLSSAQGVQMLRAAKAEGLPVSADVGVHHLHFTDADVGYFDSNMRVDPPFRSQRDREALSQALIDGTIDAICSDHTPSDDDDKLLPFAEAAPGATALELLLPLSLQWATSHQVAPLDVLRRLTQAPHQLLGASAQGTASLVVGAVADVIVIDPQAHWLCEAKALHSQGKHTPFMGYELQGQVRFTVVGGRLAYCLD